MFRTVLVATVLSATGCAAISFDQPKDSSFAITDVSQTTLALEVGEWVAENDDLSGFYPLVSGSDALGARLHLIESAESSIDAQYFLMKFDTAGKIFAGALLEAADRAVRIRLLLDDVFTTASDEVLSVLDEHSNIEVRLYNPISRRGIFALNYLGDFERANRRMHNKSFTVDNRATIIGGRNIADEYFELKQDGKFLDFDILAIGPVASEVSNTFDSFWNHSHAIPLEYVAKGTKPDLVDVNREAIYDEYARAQDSVYADATNSTLTSDLYDDVVRMYPASADVITDSPSKLETGVDTEQQALVNHLAQIVDRAESEVIVITPYFVPLSSGIEYWRRVAGRGVRVVIITNSLASNNHIPVHSGYAKFRRPILEAGVELYEIRADAVDNSMSEEGAAPGSVTLHTKVVIIDRELLFAGSLNLDPRSIEINAEMGIVVGSPEMATALARIAMDSLPEMAYRLELDADGKLRWRATIDGVEVIETSEPLSSSWRRLKAIILRVVPDSQL